MNKALLRARRKDQVYSILEEGDRWVQSVEDMVIDAEAGHCESRSGETGMHRGDDFDAENWDATVDERGL